ncbi:hypothetical protein [Flavobacterium sp. MK4S-17]|uniref:hypothetical protein n=1 Tax=Flavobacterium sp. MK4S-17 TaxID=2543737 RepID=UPI00135A6014|nr:hypothetical protein [Flavobacterium sp. MK4S-17]
MKRKKGLILLGIIIAAAFVNLIFIKHANDHKECNDITVKYKDAEGNDVIEKRHICKEQFNF